MNRFYGWSFIVSAALVVLLCSTIKLFAAPFVVGQTTCGNLTKVKDNTGAVSWVVNGCPELEKAILEQQTCGDGVLDMNEQCDIGPSPGLDPAECTNPDFPYCSGCHCVAQITATPTPTPTSTPNNPGACPQGELPFDPHLNTYGVQFQRFASQGQSLTWCFTVTSASKNILRFSFAGDQLTGVWAHISVTPPAGSGANPFIQTSAEGLSGAVTYRSVPAPVGTWLLTVTDNPTVPCPDTGCTTFRVQAVTN